MPPAGLVLKYTPMKKNITVQFIALVSIFLCISMGLQAQKGQATFPRDTLIMAAREIIRSAPFCALATVDSAGQPQVRTMNPFPLRDDFVVWFATGRKSRKVKEIMKNPHVSVYYANHANATGYVNISGTARIIDDKELLIKMKREYWSGIPNWQDIFVLIEITPVKMDVINYPHGIAGDPETSRSPVVVF
jgi:general stress protein 26